MTFHEKLDLLMNITNTTNSNLAHNVSLDPSFVSRLRRGIRTPSKTENYIKPISLFLAKHMSSEYQKVALADALGISQKGIPNNAKILTDLIYKWFFDQPLPQMITVQDFIDTLSHSGDKKAPIISSIDTENYNKSTKIDTLVSYGIEGKQIAVLDFLSLVLTSKNPQTLLLFSDEDIEWLTSSRDFIAKWASLLMQVIRRGNKIKIIHTVSRDLYEMLSAIEEWLPLYMSGAIEPYYYPKKRDGVFQRTLFIATDTAAVVSSSVGKKTANTANFLFKDTKTLLSLADEFYNYLSFCRPLMKIFTLSEKQQFFKTLWEFESEESDTLITTNTLSTITMPYKVFNNLFNSGKINSENNFLSNQELRIKSFENNLKKHSFTEAINIPDLDELRQGKVRLGFSDMAGETELFYNVEAFISHLENIIRLLKEYKNFHVTLESGNKISGCMLYVKEDVGVLVAKTSMPSVMFAINESNLIAAFWDYMEPIVNTSAKGPSEKAATIARLEKIIRQLK